MSSSPDDIYSDLGYNTEELVSSSTDESHSDKSLNDVSQQSQQQGKKRSREEYTKQYLQNGKRKKKRQRTRKFPKEYVKLLNSEIEEVSPITQPNEPVQVEAEADAEVSTCGSDNLAVWTEEEADYVRGHQCHSWTTRFVDTPGKIPSKPTAEILQFGSLLTKESQERESPVTNQSSDLQDIPSAYQISDLCCRELEKKANIVSAFEQKYEIEREKIKFGENWLLTPSTVRSMKSHGTARSRNNNQIKSLVNHDPTHCDSNTLSLAMHLLRFKTWLRFSETIIEDFVAENVEQHSPLNREAKGETSILATAAIDFLHLAVNVTKKLVSTSLFYANSRLRATNLRNTRPKTRKVKIQDVQTAVEILDMPQNLAEFRNRMTEKYDSNHDSLGPSDNACSEHLDLDDSKASKNDPDIRRAVEDQQHRVNKPTDAETETVDQEEDAQTKSIEFWDSREALIEENRLWDILQMPNEKKKPPHEIEIPAQLRSYSYNPVHWQDQMDYGSEWQRYGKVLPEEFFEKSSTKQSASRLRPYLSKQNASTERGRALSRSADRASKEHCQSSSQKKDTGRNAHRRRSSSQRSSSAGVSEDFTSSDSSDDSSIGGTSDNQARREQPRRSRSSSPVYTFVLPEDERMAIIQHSDSDDEYMPERDRPRQNKHGR